MSVQQLYYIQGYPVSNYYLTQIDWISLITLFVAVFSIGVALWQVWLARKALDDAKKSIENSTMNRQLEALPELISIIEVKLAIEHWITSLDSAIQVLESSEDRIKLEALYKKGQSPPNSVGYHPSEFDRMPYWLKRIWLSGAQYFYNATAAMVGIYASNNTLQSSYLSQIVERCKDSLKALNELRGFIDEMVPRVILNTPASIRDGEFFER